MASSGGATPARSLVALNRSTAAEDIANVVAGRCGDLPQRVEARRRSQRCYLLHAARAADGQGLRRERRAAALRRQHGLRRRAGRAARHRHGRDRGRADATTSAASARPSISTSAWSRRPSSGPSEHHQARPIPRAAVEQDRGQDPDRRQLGRRAGRGLRRRERRRLVSDHALHQPGGRARPTTPKSCASTRRPASAPTRSSRPKTSSRRSAWSSAPAGPARAR